MSVIKSGSTTRNNTFKVSWSWSGRPIAVGFHDTIAFGWTNGHTLTSYNNLKATLTCDSSRYPTYTVPNKDKDTNIPDQAVRFRFPTANQGGWLYNKGTCFLTLYNDDKISSTTMA